MHDYWNIKLKKQRQDYSQHVVSGTHRSDQIRSTAGEKQAVIVNSDNERSLILLT